MDSVRYGPHSGSRPSCISQRTARTWPRGGVVRGRRAGYVALQGELDIATAKEFGAALRATPLAGGRLIVDLRLVTFFDCAALDVLAAAKAEKPIVVHSPSPAVRRVVELVNAEELLAIEP